MVHIPDENASQAPQGQPAKPGQRPAQPPAGPRKPPTGEQAVRPGTGEQRRPPTGEQARQGTGEHKRPPGDKRPTGPAQRPPSSTRPSKILSLEPPRRAPGSGSPVMAKPNARLDQLAGPKTTSARHRGLFGTIGRERVDGAPPAQKPPAGAPGAGGAETRFIKRGAKEGAVDLGADASAAQDMIVRRKPTRRIPKPGGGIQGEAAPLDSMGSGRRPGVDPGPAPRQGANLPPIVNIPVPQASMPRRDAPPPPPAARGNTLAGVSAEELLGEDGRRMLEEMRRRETDARRSPPAAPPQRAPQSGFTVDAQGRPLTPGTQDSSRLSFQAAEYGAQEAMEQVTPSDELAPQDNFLEGPTRRIQRDVLQTPMPVDAPDPYVATPPSDDLGYERPVDFGEGGRASTAYDPQYSSQEDVVEEVVVEDSDSAPVARESAAHDEMEQRAGYLLWLQGVITREEVEDALQQAGNDVSPEVMELVAESAYADQITLYRFLARHESISPIDLSVIEPMNAALASLRPAIARSYRVIPIAKIGELLLVAAAFPFDPRRLLELRRLTASKVKLYVATEDEIEDALQRYYPASQQTLRSPKPVAQDDPDAGEVADEQKSQAGRTASDESAITGEGESLEENYDPTLSGEDSGLYAPINGSAGYEHGDVGISEADDDTGAREVASDSDLDESSLGGGDELADDAAADELDLGGGSVPSDGSTSGKDELDPFAD